MEKDWIIHAVCLEEGFYFHTHGLNKKGHKELEIDLDISPHSAAFVLHTIVDEIEKGNIYKDKDIFTSEKFMYDVVFVELEAKLPEGHEDTVLRIILVDETGKFPWDEGCSKFFENQCPEELIPEIGKAMKERKDQYQKP